MFKRNQPPAIKGRKPTKIESFRRLKELGVPVGGVIDVGVLTCTYELMEEFGDKHHLLIEPIVEFEDRIRSIYEKRGISHELVKVAVSDTDGEVPMKTVSVRDDVEITHARMADGPESKEFFRVVPMRTLDTLLAEHRLDKPYLLKIDVDGAELKILKGATKVLKDCSIVCIEMGMKTFLQRAEVIMKAGFQPFDIVDLCYYDRRLVQTDMIFLSEKIIKSLKLEVYKDGFDLSKWTPYNP